MKKTIIQFLKWILPKNWYWRIRNKFLSRNDRRFWWLTGIPYHAAIGRTALSRFDIQEGCYIESFFVDQISTKDGSHEFGPSAIIVIHGSEILKFDCYGENNAHYHTPHSHPRGIRNGLSMRFDWPEKTVAQQVDRTIFEIENNLIKYMHTHPRKTIRNTRIDRKALHAICLELKSYMLSAEKKFGSAKRLVKG